MLHEDQYIDLVIEKPVAGGRMLARHAGQVLLVSGTIPGERVRARVERVGRGVAFASVVEVLEAASVRRAPAGDPLCGGNVYAHVGYEAQPAIKAEVLRDALRHGGKIEWARDLPVASSPEHGYRMRARLHVRDGRAGFFREGTHDLCDPACTGQLHTSALDAVSRFVASTPKPWLDSIDALELAENIAGDQRTLHVLWSPRVRPPRSLPPDSWNIQALPGITGISIDHPLSGRARTVSGSPTVSDAVSQLIESPPLPVSDILKPPPNALGMEPRLQRHASSFFQANRFLLPRLVSSVARHVGDGPVVDLYAGVGLFAVTLAARGRDAIVAIEGDPSSAHDLRNNALSFASRVHVEHTSVEQYLAGSSASGESLASVASSASAGAASSAPTPAPTSNATLIVDPPRTGMSRDALTAIIGVRAARIVYVSCDVATLARDLRRLLDHGYTLAHLEAFDLFPNTAHIESLAVLSR